MAWTFIFKIANSATGITTANSITATSVTTLAIQISYSYFEF